MVLEFVWRCVSWWEGRSKVPEGMCERVELWLLYEYSWAYRKHVVAEVIRRKDGVGIRLGKGMVGSVAGTYVGV